MRFLVIGLALLGIAYFALAPLVRFGVLVFCAILFALAISTAAEWIHGKTRLPYRAAVGAVVVVLAAALVGLAWWTGPQLVHQLDEVADRVPRGIEQAEHWLRRSEVGRAVSDRVPTMPEALSSASQSGLSWLRRGIVSGAEAIGGVAIVVAVGIFFAIDPGRYTNGALRLVPERHREKARALRMRMATALRAWLVARLILMVVIGVLFGVGLRLLGIPLAFPLGVIAGVLSFIPYAGPLLSLIPAGAVGLLESPRDALHVVLLYLGVQLVESYVIEPLVEARAVALPPALLILAQVASAVWFGPIGVLIATPLFVVFMVALRTLYLERDDGRGAREGREVSARSAGARAASASRGAAAG